ncbi:MAG: hypothetical protein HOK49_01455 [Opitutae bacterium]|jgi:hypothetical protein|nr:hypothetical protein [Opitutae bacterium]MBT6461180.1 hypothetical protein [Opitutae bacterium]
MSLRRTESELVIKFDDNHVAQRASLGSQLFYLAEDNRHVLLHELGDFFPNVKWDRQNQATFQKKIDGVEICSRSITIQEAYERGMITPEQWKNFFDELKAKFESFKALSLDSETDSGNRLLIEGYQLPSYEYSPEFYRYHQGNFIVIWGCINKLQESAPVETLNTKPPPPTRPIIEENPPIIEKEPWWKASWLRWLLWVLLALLLLLLLLFALSQCNGSQEEALEPNNGPQDSPGPEQGPTEPPPPAPPPPAQPTPPHVPPPPVPEPLDLLIDDNTYHATTLSGYETALESEVPLGYFYLSEPGDNPGNRHSFPEIQRQNSLKVAVNEEAGFLKLSYPDNAAYVQEAILFEHVPSPSKDPPTKRFNKFIPDLSQHAVPGWDNLCAPTASANVLWYLAKRQHPDLDIRKHLGLQANVSDSELANQFIHDSTDKAMTKQMRTGETGTTTNGMLKGIHEFLKNDTQWKWDASSQAGTLDAKAAWTRLLHTINAEEGALLMIKLGSPPQGPKAQSLATFFTFRATPVSSQTSDEPVSWVIRAGENKVGDNGLVMFQIRAYPAGGENIEPRELEWNIQDIGDSENPVSRPEKPDSRHVLSLPPGQYQISARGTDSENNAIEAAEILQVGLSSTVTPVEKNSENK